MKDKRFSKKAVCETLNVPYNSRNCKKITLNVEKNKAYIDFYHSGWIQFFPVYEGYEEIITHYSL